MVTKEFLEAGHAILTVSNPTGEYFTYRVSKPRDFNESYPVWFVSVLTGPNNTQDYTYLGVLKPIYSSPTAMEVRTTAKSKYTNDSKPVKVIQWAVKQIYDEAKLPEGYDIKHVGRCGVCGRPLTTPESIESGIGPICAGR